ncbi:MAG: hypothetical protein ACLFPD_04165, partial [Desulfosudaceae bacterium]
AFLCGPMGWPVPGGRIQRYGDIWGGYFLQAVMRSTPFHVSFGHPVVEHQRNRHDFLADLRHEYWGMVLTDWLVEALQNRFHSEAQDIIERVRALSIFLRQQAETALPDWCPAEMKSFLIWTSGILAAWAKVCRQLA